MMYMYIYNQIDTQTQDIMTNKWFFFWSFFLFFLFVNVD